MMPHVAGGLNFEPEVRSTWLLSEPADAPAASKTMISQGTPHGRFQRAIHRRNVQNAEMAAREMGGLSLADALALCELLANTDPTRYERAALRWLHQRERSNDARSQPNSSQKRTTGVVLDTTVPTRFTESPTLTAADVRLRLDETTAERRFQKSPDPFKEAPSLPLRRECKGRS
jgi:hypothetical protein